jgi:hypothetical protein
VHLGLLQLQPQPRHLREGERKFKVKQHLVALRSVNSEPLTLNLEPNPKPGANQIERERLLY